MRLQIFVFLIISIILLSFLSASVFAIDDLLALQGNVKQGGVDLDSGNLTVYIYDSYSGGNLVYNSSTSNDFRNAIVDGKYDVMIGNSSTNELSLEYGKLYFLEIYINGEKFSFNGSDRQIFQSAVGQINASFINPGQINKTHLSGNITISQIESYEYIAFTNASESWDDGLNISMGVGGWFKGLFNWIVGDTYFNFNGSTLTAAADLTKWLYNQSVNVPQGAVLSYKANISDADWITSVIGNNTYIAQSNESLLSVNDSSFLDGYDSSYFMPFNTSVSGDFDFNLGWQNGGLSIIGGDIYAQTGFFYNITSLTVSDLSVNGSLIPMEGFNNTFDIGNSTYMWKEGYIIDIYANTITLLGEDVGTWLYNQTELTSVIANNTYWKLIDTLYQANISDFWTNVVSSAIGNSTYHPLGLVGASNLTSSIANNTYLKLGTNLFNQQLNTTDSPIFNYVNLSGDLNVTGDTWVGGGINVGSATGAGTGEINASGEAYFSGIGDNYFAGKVGIGTTSPTHELNVVGDTNITGILHLTGNEIQSYGDLVIDSGSDWIYVGQDPNNVVFGSYGNRYMQAYGSLNKVFIGEADGSMPMDLEVEDGSVCIGDGGCTTPSGDGNLLVEGGINVGTATGAGAGDIKLSGDLILGDDITTGAGAIIGSTASTYDLYVRAGRNLYLGDGATDSVRLGRGDGVGYIQMRAPVRGDYWAYYLGGIHVGGTSDPGTDNLIVDGGINVGTATGAGVGDINMSGDLDMGLSLTFGNASMLGHINIASLLGGNDVIGFNADYDDDASGQFWFTTGDDETVILNDDGLYLAAKDLKQDDDAIHYFGTDNDAQIYWDSAKSRLVIKVS